MSRKVKVLVSVLGAVVLLTIGGAATVMAQEEESASTPKPTAKVFMGTANTTGLLARVAEILGIDQEELVNAFKQAQQEMREEALDKYLKNLVDQSKITQEQADQYKAWWQAMPDMSQYQQQLKDWQQARPGIPPELKDWQQANPGIPLPGGFGVRGFRGGMKRGGGHGFPGW